MEYRDKQDDSDQEKQESKQPEKGQWAVILVKVKYRFKYFKTVRIGGEFADTSCRTIPLINRN